jgi:hypothetical protein
VCTVQGASATAPHQFTHGHTPKSHLSKNQEEKRKKKDAKPFPRPNPISLISSLFPVPSPPPHRRLAQKSSRRTPALPPPPPPLRHARRRLIHVSVLRRRRLEAPLLVPHHISVPDVIPCDAAYEEGQASRRRLLLFRGDRREERHPA